MSRVDEVARYQRVQASAAWRVQWWKRVDAIAMLDGLLADAPNQNRDALLLCERATKPNGEEVLWFRWGTAADLAKAPGDLVLESHGDEFNLSHPCPPRCPDDD